MTTPEIVYQLLPENPMRVALITTVALLLICGCRVNPNAEREIALLRAEILDLEDQYYALKSQRDSAVTQLQDCQGVSFDATKFVDPQFGDCVNCDDGAIIYETPGFELNTSDQIQTYEQGSPVIDGGGGLEEVPSVEGSSDAAGNNTTMSNGRQSAGSAVHTVRINPRISKGEDLDGTPGHEGLSLLIQPINQRGEVVNEVGQMTIQVLERDRLASSRQIGFWRFTPEELSGFQVREDFPDQGILLHLPWSQILPAKNSVSVVVNYQAPGNFRHTARIQVPIEPPRKRYSIDESLIANWIENDERWRTIDGNSGAQEINFGTAFDQPEFQNSSDLNENRASEPDSDRRTSVPRWRPVR